MSALRMLGAIAGDMIGSVYEYKIGFKRMDFPLFSTESKWTDDSLLTVAVADAILHGGAYEEKILAYARRFPHSDFGGNFLEWMNSSNPMPYNSLGNGSAMRVSAVGWAFDSAEEVLSEAKKSAEVTHNHPEGIKGAQATALAIFRGRSGTSKDEIREETSRLFKYDLSEPVDSIRKWYGYDVTCPGTVPQAISAFLESNDFEDAIRKAVSLGGDADTLAAITGAIAEAYYGEVPQHIVEEVKERLLPEFWKVIEIFNKKFMPRQQPK
jgi:ADP-ribosylglycohydrolase